MEPEKARKFTLLTHEEWRKVQPKFCKSRVPKKINKKEYKMDLIDVKKVLEKNGIECWLIFGTLLGAVRDNDFLEWDDNINFAVYEEVFLPKINKLKDQFNSLGFIFRQIPKDRGTKINLHRFRHKTSIEALFLDASYKNNKYRCSNKFRHPRKYFEKHGTIKFKGETFRVPTPVKKYLKLLYKNWKIPVELKNLSSPEKWRNKESYKR